MDDVRPGLLGNGYYPVCIHAGEFCLPFINLPVNRFIPFREPEENQVVNSNYRRHMVSDNIKGDLIAKSVIQFYSVPDQLLSQPVAAPEGGKFPFFPGLRVDKGVVF